MSQIPELSAWVRLVTRVRACLKNARSDEEVDLRYVVDRQIEALTRALAQEEASRYEKLAPEHGEVYQRVRALKRLGDDACDAVGHNAQDQYGCPNPACWKHIKLRPRKRR